MPNKNFILESPIGVVLARLSFPILLSSFLQTGYMLTDSFWVGRLGATAVAAVSISSPITYLVIALGSGFSSSGAILVAQHKGAGQQDMVNHIAAQSLIMVILSSIILSGFGYAITPLILTSLNVAHDTYHSAEQFMRASFISIPFVFSYAMYQALMRGVGKVTSPLLIVFFTVLLNFILDPLFIYGKGVIPAMGVTGAAVATLLTQFLATLIGFIILFRGKSGINLTIKDFRIDFKYMKKSFLLGAPTSIELSSRSISQIIMSFIAIGFASHTMAAYGIGANILQGIMIPATALATALSTIVGQNIGAGNTERAQAAILACSKFSFFALSIIGILAYLFAPSVVAFFVNSDVQAINLSVNFLRTMCLTWGFIGISTCISSSFRAEGNVIAAMAISIVSQWVFQVPLAYFLANFTEYRYSGIWWSFPITNLITAIVAVLGFINRKKKEPLVTASLVSNT